jgi:UTP-glucose-1-phosphate uridylyltransferase
VAVGKPFKEQLLEYRTRARFDRKDLAARADLSPSYIYYLETGRKPTRHVVYALADALRLNASERDELLIAAGHTPLPETLLESAVRPIRSVLENPGVPDDQREDLVKEVQEFVGRWRRQREARKREIRKAVILTAGWQPRLLSARSLTETLVHAAEEAEKAGISEVVLVAAPETPESPFEEMRARFKIRVTIAAQERPVGLGNAVLSAREHVGEEPFAVILPDDVDPSRTALKEMVGQYRKIRRPMIAVNPEVRAALRPEMRYYGIAILGKAMARDRRLYHVQSVHEKPRQIEQISPESRMIVGRYILTPEVFDILRSLPPNEETGKYELTDGLAELLKSQVVCAYQLRRNLLPLAPVRSVMEKLIASIKDRSKFERIVQLTEKVLEEIERV